MSALAGSWQFWAGLAACSAALTALFAKLGVSGIDPDLATFLRTAAELRSIPKFGDARLREVEEKLAVHRLTLKALGSVGANPHTLPA